MMLDQIKRMLCEKLGCGGDMSQEELEQLKVELEAVKVALEQAIARTDEITASLASAMIKDTLKKEE